VARRKPAILFIDDQPLGLESLRTALEDARLLIMDPEAVDEKDLLEADLVVVDVKLTQWRGRLSSVLAKWPDDGLALIAVLRSHIERLEKAKPTSFAIFSSFLAELAGPLPAEYRAHALARLLNLEWVFDKTGPASVQLLRMFFTLAHATQDLPDEWPQRDYEATRDLVSRLLAISLKKTVKTGWHDQAWADVESCHPPIHDLVEESHGLAFLRWILHRILPYPCFLWDDRQLAVRLGLKTKGMAAAFDDFPPALRELRACEYSGIAAGFLGRRWWRAGIEQALWGLTDGASSDLDVVRQELASRGFMHPAASEKERIICIDEKFNPLDDLQSPQQVVRIQPDDWPPYADSAWTTIDLAKRHTKLRALVLAEDRDLLTSGRK
jgi:hypothetical protein